LHAAEPFVESAGHFGSRLAFDADDRLYVTVGDRQFKNFGPDHTSQDLTTELGTTLRFEADGRVPDDNPFVDDPEARDTVFSYGHRNSQGMAVHPETGDVWQSEYGEQDGDELNVVVRGGNYGWPVADEGCTYGSGQPIGVSHDERDDVVAPAYSWPCGSGGFPPGGATFYTGDAFPAWRGDLFVGGLAAQALGRFTVDGRSVTGADRLLADRGWRIRTVAEAPDTGHLYVAVDAGSAPVVRLRPA
jgi:quinoprotein glucose dehydrogenase